ncbi:uncharacterized protein PG986_002796 [Apiospora aurea]|uniref:Xylanolytic transcriptional activator regulatory domain-containing protein n=1 Tax=Apiospora aurea TaxID=335848 RepID=A0ABR1QPU4_9PEZI
MAFDQIYTVEKDCISSGTRPEVVDVELEATSSSSQAQPDLDRITSGRADLGPAEFPVNQAIQYLGLGGFYFNGIHLGGISSNQGIPFFSKQGKEWIHAHTGSKPAPQRPCPPNAPTQVTGLWELPDRTVVKTYFSIFTTSIRRYVFPIIDEAAFPNVIEKAYNGHPDRTDVVCAKACVLAFTCIQIHMEGQLDIQPALTVRADQCAARCMYNMFTGNVAAAATYLSVAYRFVSMLGAHLNPASNDPTSDPDSPHSSQHYLRRVFWHCYMYDKDISLRGGYISIINDDYCDLSLPPGYKEIDGFDSFKDGTDLIPGDMRLTIIKSNMIRRLYCAKAFRTSEVDLLKHIRELDDELDQWRISIPPRYRPSLVSSYRMEFASDWNKAKQAHILVIHFEYYFLLSLIHSASGRCRVPASGGVDHRASVNSCQCLALQASRATLANLPVVSQVLSSGDFWYFIQYPMSASLTIFCNILTSPLNSQAEQDLELLKRVPRLIRDMCAVPCVSPGDNMRIRQVEQFVEELLRLGRSAVQKAAAEG